MHDALPWLGACVVAAPLAIGPGLHEARPDRVSATTATHTTADILDDAMALVRDGDKAGAAALLEGHLSTEGGPLDSHVLLGELWIDLERPGAAAHAWERGLASLAEQGEDGSGEFKDLRGRLEDLDELAKARRALTNKLLNLLADDTIALAREDDHALRALDFLRRIHPICLDERRATLAAELDRVAKKFEAVDLDAAGGGNRRLVRHVSKYYEIEADLEEPVVKLVGDTMDSICESYIEIYLDGERSRVPRQKVKLRIHASWEAMTGESREESTTPGLGGWWEPWSKRVVCYDTRTDSGTLDVMLGTLFHEASHQFMTVLAERGGTAPAWLNEGTASFFEGAQAMADRRVLWPDAARSRLRNLVAMMPSAGQGEIPTFEDVVGYDQPGSYPGSFYAWGWGIVYYLLQYEDSDTLAYVWRPYYETYKERITKEGGDHLDLFEDIFLASGNPGGFDTTGDFAAGWREWVLNTVHPLQMGDDRRDLRLARVDEYVAAADAPRGGVTREDLLLRALRDVEFVRTRLDDEPDAAVLEKQIAILKDLGRTAAEAAIIEELLDMVDDGALEMTEDAYEELAERMYAIDKENELPRRLKVRAANQRKRARELMDRYLALEPALPERALSFAEQFGAALDDRQLLETAARLRAEQRGSSGGVAAPVAAGARIEGREWVSMFPKRDETRFRAQPDGVTIASEDEVAARVCTEQAFGGRWVVRGWLARVDGSFRSQHGVVLGGAEGSDWLVAKVDGNGVMTLERWRLEDDEPEDERIERVTLEVEDEADVWIECVVDTEEGYVDVTFEPGEEPERVWLEDLVELADEVHVGVFAQKGETHVRDLSVEVLE